MTPTHHPPDTWLLEHAAGALGVGEGLIVASHGTLCPQCRRELVAHEEAAGAALDALPPVDLSVGALDAVLGRLGAQEPAPVQAAPSPDAVLPSALQELSGPLEDIRWRTLIPGIQWVPLDAGADEQVRLYRFRPGLRVPLHHHTGLERTLVLSGGYSDDRGRYEKGDLAVRGEASTHDVLIDDHGLCLALIVTDGPLVPANPLSRMGAWLIGH